MTTETQEAPAVEATTEVAQINATTKADATEGDGESKETQVEKTFTQAELNEIVQKQKAKAEARAERRATQAYREALETVTRGQGQKRTQSEPTRDQFASDAEWIDAKVDFKLRQRDSAAQEQYVQATQEKINKTAEDIYDKAEKLGSFDRDDFNELPLTRPIAEALMESEKAPQLLHFLAGNPKEIERISNLSATRQAVEIGKLESALSTTAKKSTVPAPITPIGAKGSAPPNLLNASFADYKKLRGWV
jgi:type II secretory pathway pseudopilin PulG